MTALILHIQEHPWLWLQVQHTIGLWLYLIYVARIAMP